MRFLNIHFGEILFFLFVSVLGKFFFESDQ